MFLNTFSIFVIANCAILTIAYPEPQYAKTQNLPTVSDEYVEEEIHKVYEQDAEEGRPGRYLVNIAYPTGDEDDLTAVEDYRHRRSLPSLQHLRPLKIYVNRIPYSTYQERVESKARPRRSLQPGAPVYGGGRSEDRNHGVSIDRSDGRNTRVTVDSQHKGDRVDVDGQWSKVVRGPGKSKPEWRVGVKW